MTKGRLNLDITGSVIALKAVVKRFFLKREFYELIFQSKGLEFEGYRDYTQDDNADAIDWKASTRAQKLLVRKYRVERELKIAFIIDVGNNMVFGSTPKLKCEYAADMITAMTSLIVESNNYVGFVMFSDGIRYVVPFGSGQKHMLRCFDAISNGSYYGGKSNLNYALDHAIKYFDKTVSSVFIVSDFLDITPNMKEKLTYLSRKFDIIAVRVNDPLDITLPNIEGNFVIQDPNTRAQLLINPKIARKNYERYTKERAEKVRKIFRNMGVTCIDLNTSESFVRPISIFLRERMLKVM